MWFGLCFFFQAEDGIRDLIVTGVQTCALPISLLIFDEVKTCGKWYGGAEEAFGVVPHVKVFGKAIGGGFPLAAVGGGAPIMDPGGPGQIAHTGEFQANPLSPPRRLWDLVRNPNPAGISD